MINVILLVIITIFIPPVGVFLVSGCGADLIINILLTILGYLPGHIHAFYIEYKYYKAREQSQVPAQEGYVAPAQQGYGTVGTTAPQHV